MLVSVWDSNRGSKITEPLLVRRTFQRPKPFWLHPESLDPFWSPWHWFCRLKVSLGISGALQSQLQFPAAHEWAHTWRDFPRETSPESATKLPSQSYLEAEARNVGVLGFEILWWYADQPAAEWQCLESSRYTVVVTEDFIKLPSSMGNCLNTILIGV